MPKRVIDFDAMWGSDKLASCADWAQAEYAWLYGLADASGCFEMTNLRVIWGRVAAIRENFTIERLEQVFAEFQDKGLLFVWMHEGKRYAHWTGSDVPGRLPPPSWRMRLEKFAPPVPKAPLSEYMARFARGRAALAGVGFRGESAAGAGNDDGNFKLAISNLKSERSNGAVDGHFDERGSAAGYENCEAERRGEISQPGNLRNGGRENCARKILLKGGVEEDQAQDLDLDLNLDLNWNGKRVLERDRASAQVLGEREENKIQDDNFGKSNASSRTNSPANANSTANALTGLKASSNANSDAGANSRAASTKFNSNANTSSSANSGFNSDAAAGLNAMGNEMRYAAAYRMSAREVALERELRVGAGPVCGPVRIRPEVLERIRLREEARARSVTRSP